MLSVLVGAGGGPRRARQGFRSTRACDRLLLYVQGERTSLHVDPNLVLSSKGGKENGGGEVRQSVSCLVHAASLGCLPSYGACLLLQQTVRDRVDDVRRKARLLREDKKKRKAATRGRSSLQGEYNRGPRSSRDIKCAQLPPGISCCSCPRAVAYLFHRSFGVKVGTSVS